MSIFDLFTRHRLTEATASHEGDAETVRITEQVNPTMMATSAPTQKDWYCLSSIKYVLNALAHVEHPCYNRTTSIVLPRRCCKHPRAWTNLVGGSSMDILHPNSDSLKTCNACQRVLPATTEYFHRNKNSKDGLDRECKVCKSSRAKAYYAAHKEECQARNRQWKATHQKEVRANRRQYHAGHKEQFREYWKRYRRAHQEQINERQRKYQETHAEELSEYWKRYRRNHQEQINERQRKYQETHAEELSERRRRYREAHAEELAAKQRTYYVEHLSERLQYIKQYKQTERGILVHRASSHNHRARKKSAPGSHTAQQLHEQYQRQRGRCYYCHKKLGASRKIWHTDHILPLSRGGSNDIHNLVITCPQCNCKKQDKLPHEWAEGGRLL